jgi:hypothetical protein
LKISLPDGGIGVAAKGRLQYHLPRRVKKKKRVCGSRFDPEPGAFPDAKYAWERKSKLKKK